MPTEKLLNPLFWSHHLLSCSKCRFLADSSPLLMLLMVISEFSNSCAVSSSRRDRLQISCEWDLNSCLQSTASYVRQQGMWWSIHQTIYIVWFKQFSTVTAWLPNSPQFLLHHVECSLFSCGSSFLLRHLLAQPVNLVLQLWYQFLLSLHFPLHPAVNGKKQISDSRAGIAPLLKKTSIVEEYLNRLQELAVIQRQFPIGIRLGNH